MENIDPQQPEKINPDLKHEPIAEKKGAGWLRELMGPAPENGERPKDERTDEEKRIAAIKAQARKNVIAAANRYIHSGRDRKELEYIQKLVDELQDAFVLVVPQKDGVAWSITFNPGEAVPQVPEDDVQYLELPCLYCRKNKKVRADSGEGRGDLNVFCGGECEDKYAATL